jgi:hypothetical protein
MAFQTLRMPETVAFTAAENLQSIRVMEQPGMKRDRQEHSEHPAVTDVHLQQHVLYRATQKPPLRSDAIRTVHPFCRPISSEGWAKSESSEHMRSAGELYRWGIVVGHNGIVTEANPIPTAPGGGSCIFLHIWRSPGQGTGRMHCYDANRKPCFPGSIQRASHCWYNCQCQNLGRLIHRWKLPTLINGQPH